MLANIENKIEAWINANASNKVKTIEIFEAVKEFAKDFALWKEYQVQQDDDGNYYSQKNILISENKPVNIHSLLDIYLDEKRLWNKHINNLK